MRKQALGAALLAACGAVAADSPPGRGRAPDWAAPQISVSPVPAVATSQITPISVTYFDDVELAYVSPVSTSPYGSPFLVLPEGTKSHRIDGSIAVDLGRTATLTLVAVDMAGNVAKRTITIASPDVPFKFGSYAITGPNTLPAAFDCRPSWAFPPPPYGGPIDGQVVPSFYVGSATAPGPLPAAQWSVAEGYRPSVSLNSFGAFSPTANIPLNSVSFAGEGGGGSMSGSSGSFEYKFQGSAVVVQMSPRTIQLTYTMSCNINRTGWINGAATTFTGVLSQ